MFIQVIPQHFRFPSGQRGRLFSIFRPCIDKFLGTPSGFSRPTYLLFNHGIQQRCVQLQNSPHYFGVRWRFNRRHVIQFISFRRVGPGPYALLCASEHVFAYYYRGFACENLRAWVSTAVCCGSVGCRGGMYGVCTVHVRVGGWAIVCR